MNQTAYDAMKDALTRILEVPPGKVDKWGYFAAHNVMQDEVRERAQAALALAQTKHNKPRSACEAYGCCSCNTCCYCGD